MRLVLTAALLVLPPQTADTTIPANATTLYTVKGRGVQIYHCTGASSGVSGTAQWSPAVPEAALLDSSSGRQVGTHSAGPTWTWNDGSAVRGKVVERMPAPDSADIPWLLLSAEPAGAATGELARVKWVRRSETHGGVAPASGCDAAHPDATARVSYTATYTFYTAAAASR